VFVSLSQLKEELNKQLWDGIKGIREMKRKLRCGKYCPASYKLVPR
jgi:hypothetical protein